MKIIETILRLAQFSFVAIILGLCGALLEQQDRGGTPTRLNYSMYAAALAALCLFYLIPAIFIPAIRSPLAIVILDGLNFIFLSCAGIALAAALGGKDCTNPHYLATDSVLNGGAPSAPRIQRCREANALTAFEWFAAFSFLASMLVVAYEMKKNGDMLRLKHGHPSMRSRV